MTPLSNTLRKSEIGERTAGSTENFVTIISDIISKSNQILTSSESYTDRPLGEKLLARTGSTLYVKSQKEFKEDIKSWEEFKENFADSNGFSFPDGFEEEEHILMFLIHSDYHKGDSTTLRKYFEESTLCKKHPGIIKSLEIYFEKINQKRFPNKKEG